jgi:hypothetical protein
MPPEQIDSWYHPLFNLRRLEPFVRVEKWTSASDDSVSVSEFELLSEAQDSLAHRAGRVGTAQIPGLTSGLPRVMKRDLLWQSLDHPNRSNSQDPLGRRGRSREAAGTPATNIDASNRYRGFRLGKCFASQCGAGLHSDRSGQLRTKCACEGFGQFGRSEPRQHRRRRMMLRNAKVELGNCASADHQAPPRRQTGRAASPAAL